MWSRAREKEGVPFPEGIVQAIHKGLMRTITRILDWLVSFQPKRRNMRAHSCSQATNDIFDRLGVSN